MDLTSAIYRCRELVDDDSKIIIDVIDLSKSVTGVPSINETGSAYSNYLRYK